MKKLMALFFLIPFSCFSQQESSLNPYEIISQTLSAIEDVYFIADDIKRNKVDSVEAWIKYFHKEKVVDSSLAYTIAFNEEGNPVSYYRTYQNYNVKLMVEIKQWFGIRKPNIHSIDCRFSYDNFSRLTNAVVYEKRSLIEYYSKEDVSNIYDKYGRLVSQIIENKTICPDGYAYRGTAYHNDTSTYSHHFNYDGKK